MEDKIKAIIEAMDDDENSPFCIDDLVDRIVRNENAFGRDEIAAVLNGEDDFNMED